MAHVMMDAIFETEAEKVWEVIKDFNGLPKFLKVVAHSRTSGVGIGSIRTLTLQDGSMVMEKLESIEDAPTRELTYSIVTSQLPVDDYRSTMRIFEVNDNKCMLSWTSTFNPKNVVTESEATSIIKGIYSMGFEGLSLMFGSRAS